MQISLVNIEQWLFFLSIFKVCLPPISFKGEIVNIKSIWPPYQLRSTYDTLQRIKQIITHLLFRFKYENLMCKTCTNWCILNIFVFSTYFSMAFFEFTSTILSIQTYLLNCRRRKCFRNYPKRYMKFKIRYIALAVIQWCNLYDVNYIKNKRVIMTNIDSSSQMDQKIFF